MAASDATLRAFFQSGKFAVVGASTNTEKFGYKGKLQFTTHSQAIYMYCPVLWLLTLRLVFRWYATRGLPVTPINPGAKAIEIDGKEYPTVASLSELPNPQETSVSIITPPHVTLKTLEEAKALGIQSVFLQPGTFDEEVLKYANQNFKTVLAGNGGAGPEGWCVLVDGDRGLRSAGKL